MAEAIRMPLLSDTMKEGVIAEWHFKVGDKVRADDAIADVETDKATMEVMPYVDGTLLYVGVKKGEAAKINQIIAIVGKEGEDYKALLDGGDDVSQTKPQEETAPNPSSTPAKETGEPVAPSAPVADKPKATKPSNATVVRMPLLSDTMKEGKIVAWHKQVGDKVKGDDVLAEVETDKATMEVMGYADGTLLYVGVKEGEAAKINDIIAIVGKEGTDVEAYLNDEGSEAPTPAANDNATPHKSEGAEPAEKQQESNNNETASSGERLKISPLARKMAKDKGIDPATMKGSGDGGRIIKRDVDEYKPVAAAASKKGVETNGSQAPAFTPGEEGYIDHSLSQMRRVIAQRLSESKFSAPHFYLRISVTMDNAVTSRNAINDVSPVKVSFNDLIIKACAMALRMHPAVNSSWMKDAIRENKHIHIGSAVAIDEGLIVPVIKFADQKSLSQIAQDSSSLSKKAREKKLQPSEFTGNTFTISNLGMMDIDEFTAIINPPDACILAVGKIAPTPVVENNQVVVRQMLKLTLSCDHRVVDGAVAARFLQTLKSYLENPVTMLA